LLTVKDYMVKGLSELSQEARDIAMLGICNDCAFKTESCTYDNLDCDGLIFREENLNDFGDIIINEHTNIF